MPQRGIDRVNQIQTRIDQGSIEIENYQLEREGIELAIEFDQGRPLAA